MRRRDAAASDRPAWADGAHDAVREVLGSHSVDDGSPGVGRWEHRVRAPNATAISLVDNVSGWNPTASPVHGQPGGVALPRPPLAVVVLTPGTIASEPTGGS